MKDYTEKEIKELIENEAEIFVVEDSILFQELWKELNSDSFKVKTLHHPKHFLKSLENKELELSQLRFVFLDQIFDNCDMQGEDLALFLRNKPDFNGKIIYASSSLPEECQKNPELYDGFFNKSQLMMMGL